MFNDSRANSEVISQIVGDNTFKCLVKSEFAKIDFFGKLYILKESIIIQINFLSNLEGFYTMLHIKANGSNNSCHETAQKVLLILYKIDFFR